MERHDFKGFTVEQIITAFDNSKVEAIIASVKDGGYLDYHTKFEDAAKRLATAEGVLYKILGDACSMMFRLDANVYGPYFWLANGRRSASIEDFVGDVAKVLLGVFDKAENPLIKARVADILWVNRKLTKYERPIRFAKTALAGYCDIKVNQELWFEGRNEEVWFRAIELALSLKSEGHEYIVALEKKLLALCDVESEEGHDLLIKIGRIFLESGLPLEDGVIIIKKAEDRLFALTDPKHIFEINDIYDLLIQWYEKEGRHDEVNRCLFAKAEANRVVGDRWADENVDSMMLSTRYELAQRCYDKLPKKFKSDNNVAELASIVRKSLHAAYKKTVDGMQHIYSDKVDIGELVGSSRRQMHGLDFSSAICKFVMLFDLDVVQLKESTLKMVNEHPILGLFQHTTYENNRVASRLEGLDFNDPNFDKSPRFHQMVVQQFSYQLSFVWQACLLPAFSVMREEHQLVDADFYAMMESSRFVPDNRRFMFARGIKAGWFQDFQTAAALLLPQIENSVRVLLKRSGNDTLAHNGIKEIDSELGLSNLVCRDEMMGTLFNENLCFMMQAMFGPPPNFNLRNQYAHGLVDDCNGINMYDFYIWYVALKLIIFGCVDRPEKVGLKI